MIWSGMVSNEFKGWCVVIELGSNLLTYAHAAWVQPHATNEHVDFSRSGVVAKHVESNGFLIVAG